MKLDAILWDYDGTLVNSVPKNIDITKNILSIVAPHLTGDNLPKYLWSEESYHVANHEARNWQELYLEYYGMSHSEMTLAGSLWSEHQERNQTPVEVFEGINSVLSKYSQIPHGICSQNSQLNIRNVLEQNGLNEYFLAIVGYDDVSNSYQKPHPFGGLKCVESIVENKGSKRLIYIGDHEADVEFARNLEASLNDGSKVISIAVGYSHSQPENWSVQPDHFAKNVSDLTSIIAMYE
ncbi:HAD family hydrolase [Vibrio parahaemolyticus]|uniref:HAD family hydrolase n=1 Tax=Vibrio parahaemolyticus TaxID=670 RepID=UPI0004153556|nr:HAD family hydrolase [Vibrio parahaemolyticus]OOI05783.1 phosphatase [Vibrio sp. OULL4]EHW0694342.1 HAD family hydrolase [Vibrio parahaemolyticus]EIU6803774.1 HAD family hydrolase [Vibrio parahaemolyticus]EJC6794869.1 HAD family hydrolase [Vibrio parahaemolyticus]EJC7054581.1 HAD family hydrolase [Vibrio parahaemolyticus]